ncbi:MAG TPA: pitrilysin family protein [Chitinophagaceae bacterium]|nr:pitrilysin family protein [Chitinophagaceae bacterium]
MKYNRIIIVGYCLLLLGGSALAQSNTREINYEGLKIIFKKTPKQVITASLFIKGGSANITETQQGLEALALNLALDGGTTSINKDEFAMRADKLGTNFSATAARDYSKMTMTCLKDKWTESWAMFADAILHPAMDENEFGVIKSQMISTAKQQESDPDAYLRKMATQSLFGGTDYAKLVNGTPSTLETISIADAKKYYTSLLGKKRCFLVVVGNVEETDLLNNIKNTLAKLPAGQEPKKPTFKSVSAPNATIQDRAIATNYILGVLNAPKYNTAEGPLFEFAMSILYDRYFVELRTKRSLSYAPAAFYNRNTIEQPTANLYITSIDPKQSLQVMTDIINDIKKNGFTDKEVKDKKKEYLTNYYLTNEASASQAGELGFCEASGNWRLFDEINSKIDLVKTADLNKTFGKYMKTIDWSYLGKQDKVSKEDFKQLAPTAEKLPDSKLKKTKKQ